MYYQITPDPPAQFSKPIRTARWMGVIEVLLCVPNLYDAKGEQDVLVTDHGAVDYDQMLDAAPLLIDTRGTLPAGTPGPGWSAPTTRSAAADDKLSVSLAFPTTAQTKMPCR